MKIKLFILSLLLMPAIFGSDEKKPEIHTGLIQLEQEVLAKYGFVTVIRGGKAVAMIVREDYILFHAQKELSNLKNGLKYAFGCIKNSLFCCCKNKQKDR